MKTFLKTPFGYSLAAILATLLWGSAFPAVKVGYTLARIQRDDIFLQLEFAGYRFVLAACMLIVLCIVIYRRFFFTARQVVFIIGLGVVQTFLQYVFFYVGLSMSSGVTSSIIAGTLTFFQLGLAHLLYHDNEITVTKVIAALVGFSGVVFYLLMDNDMQITIGFGAVFMFAAMFFAAFGNVLYRKAPDLNLNPLPLTALQMLLGGLGLMIVGGMKVGFVPFDMTSSLTVNLVYLSLVSAVSFLMWNSIMTYNDASKVSVFLFLIPIFGVVLSSIILGEHLSWYIFPALVLVTISIAVTQKSRGYQEL
jgi:drug/metabolite transporter (DMT)-like permease